jgi:hypothetical protein
VRRSITSYFRSLIDDLVGRADAEIRVTQLNHRARAAYRRADGSAHDGRFGDRGIDNAMPAELLLQAQILAGYPAFRSQVLAQRPHGRIAFHLLL